MKSNKRLLAFIITLAMVLAMVPIVAVAKATPIASDFTFTAPSNLTYDGNAKSATVAAKSDVTGMGTVTVNYYSGTTKLASAPTDAGTYTVTIDVAEGDNYVATTDLTDDSWIFIISKATPDASNFHFNSPSDLTYDGKTKKAIVEFKSDVTGMGEDITVNYFSGNIKLVSAPVDAGTYTLKIDVDEGDNYAATTDLTDESWTFTIVEEEKTTTQTTETSEEVAQTADNSAIGAFVALGAFAAVGYISLKKKED